MPLIYSLSVDYSKTLGSTAVSTVTTGSGTLLPISVEPMKSSEDTSGWLKYFNKCMAINYSVPINYLFGVDIDDALDGMSPERCLEVFTANQRCDDTYCTLTPNQLAKAKELWTISLMALKLENEAKVKLTITCESQYDLYDI